MSKKITKESLVQYIKEQAESLFKLQTLKEQKEKIEGEIKLINEGKYSKEAQKFISSKMKKMADEDIPQDQKVAIAMSYARKKGLKVPKKSQ